MSKIDDLTRLKHIRDAVLTTIDFVKGRNRGNWYRLIKVGKSYGVRL
jgi:hypothetical protein